MCNIVIFTSQYDRDIYKCNIVIFASQYDRDSLVGYIYHSISIIIITTIFSSNLYYYSSSTPIYDTI